MVAKQSAPAGTDKRKARPTRAGIPTPTVTRASDQEHRFVDIEPCAVLLEQLMQAPEEQPAERKGGKRE